MVILMELDNVLKAFLFGTIPSLGKCNLASKNKRIHELEFDVYQDRIGTYEQKVSTIVSIRNQ